jgi:rhodanese-related sulfurtransferase
MITKSFIKDGIPTVTSKDVQDLKDVTLIDVRMPDEYIGELGHIEGTRLITIGHELESFLETTPKQVPIIFICRSGARSGRATTAALALGFKNVYNMEGGMLAWNSLALPISK